MVADLDRAIQAQPALAGLPGRFLFGLDDGRGDISGLAADVGIQIVGDSAALLLAGRDTGVRLSMSDAVPSLVTVACRFADSRGTCWRISELDEPKHAPGGLRGDGKARCDVGAGHPAARSAGSSRTTAGWLWARRFRWAC